MLVISSSTFTPLMEPSWVESMLLTAPWLVTSVLALSSAWPRPATVESYESLIVWLFKPLCVAVASWASCVATVLSSGAVALAEACTNEGLPTSVGFTVMVPASEPLKKLLPVVPVRP